ncbi:hypothetical protein [Streptomyces sp. NPDC001450]
MIRVIRTVKLKQFCRSLTALHDRAGAAKTRADTAEHRIDKAMQVLDALDVAQDHIVRQALKGDLV